MNIRGTRRQTLSRGRPTPEQVQKLADDIMDYRRKHQIPQNQMKAEAGFPYSGATVSQIENGGDYTIETYNGARAWMDEQQRKETPPKPPEETPKAETMDAENLGVLLAKIAVMAEQLNTLLEVQQKDHQQLMQLTPYIKHWANIKKRLQLYRYDD